MKLNFKCLELKHLVSTKEIELFSEKVNIFLKTKKIMFVTVSETLGEETPF
jgi:hypothetical protein